MDRAEESAFVWALMDGAGSFLSTEARAWLCVKIGAGEQDRAILDLLRGFVRNDAALPPVLAGSLWAWMGGFVGSEGETALRELAFRLRLSDGGFRAYP
ncbi:hypothetical protein A5719_21860 [Mycolicibacterium peregrinum]|uniref:hypothetical protein n=1 Tax=Mycolicibacterium peregrinum TaxID=43304 RepID=UPI0007EA7BB1|nr:hypothetical protein [Mycolicibacterium peregrinum]OBF37458.1 hypothetical protein A5719_21860 [Mycolicibacterium peregrinum]